MSGYRGGRGGSGGQGRGGSYGGRDSGRSGGRDSGRSGGRSGGRGGGRGGGGGGRGNYDPPTAALAAMKVSEIAPLFKTPTAPIPSRVLATSFPARKAYGKMGIKCSVVVNHFSLKLKSHNDVYHYDIGIAKDADTGDDQSLSNACRKRVIRRFITTSFPEFNGIELVSDGVKNIYTATKLPFARHEFRNNFPDDADPDFKGTTYRITIKESEPVYVRISQLSDLAAGKLNFTPYDAIQALDIAMYHTCQLKYTMIGRNFFNAQEATRDLSGGLNTLAGFHQSIRPTQSGLTVNVDVAASAFLKVLPLVTYVKEYLQLRDLPKSLDRMHLKRVKTALFGIKVSVTHRQTRRHYRISGLCPTDAHGTRFDVRDNEDDPNSPVTNTSVFDYFKRKFKVTLKHPSLPCLTSGHISLPMECCVVAPGQKFIGMLNENQTSEMIKFTCVKPSDRQRRIMNLTEARDYKADKKLKAFGLEVTPQMMHVEARILPSPVVVYGRNKTEQPRDGSWNMRDKQFYKPVGAKAWAIISFDNRVQKSQVETFCKALVMQMNEKGMTTKQMLPPMLMFDPRGTERVDAIYSRAIAQATAAFKSPCSFVLCIKSDMNADIYAEIKRASDSKTGVVSQVMQAKNIPKCNDQYISNILMKINVKLGGTNGILKVLPRLTSSRGSTMIMGADVTHPSPFDTSRPSIAALACSVDVNQVGHVASIRKQGHRVEKMEYLKEMTIECLKLYYKKTGKKPDMILFYRDGVSEGQFQMVLDFEVTQLREAFASLDVNYKPKITFVVVQKRHNTRLFPHDPKFADRSGNVKAGTVVETGICHPSEQDFYLMSHAGLQGTSRPTHYHVLLDENNFTPDDLQILTFHLCHVYARCCKSVSIVPSVYYAHLIAFRARFLLEDDSEAGSVSSGKNGNGKASATSGKLHEINALLKGVMFFV